MKNIYIGGICTEYVGPFSEEYYVLTFGGYKIPYIKATRDKNNIWALHLDNNTVLPEITEEELNKWIGFLVEAMAMSAGLTCFGENSKPLNIFKQRMISLSESDIKDIEEE